MSLSNIDQSISHATLQVIG